MTIPQLATLFFAVTITVGITLASFHLRKKNLPIIMVIGHGIFAVLGLICLILVVREPEATDLITVAFLLFVISTLGGISLLAFHLRREPLPTVIVLLHGLAAVMAFVFLVFDVLGIT